MANTRETCLIQGQESWVLKSSGIHIAITKLGGHLGPARFQVAKGKWVEPFDVAPWAEETVPEGTPNLLRVMRGDFFCMPFGGNETAYRQEKYPPHGETANNEWRAISVKQDCIQLEMETAARKGLVQKFIQIEGNAIYSKHVISKMSGPMSFGHHPILLFPEGCTGRLSTSRFVYGRVFPGSFEDAASGGYSILKAGAEFSSLRRVPRSDGDFADLSIYPAREGYEDLVLMASDIRLPFAWTAVVFPEEGYVWFSIKDPRILRSTVFWMSNGGRHYAPWNGRHRRAIGVEEVTSNFHYGLAESAKPNPLSREGIQTCVHLDPRHPLEVNYIMAVAGIPRGFDRVKNIRSAPDGKSVTLFSDSKQTADIPLHLSFLRNH